jgi:dTDP-4-dehydrorhamnose 3,5-epimerase
MKVIKSSMPEVLIIQPKVFTDYRGFFLETFSAEAYRDIGIGPIFVQDNHSRSIKNTLRGLHYQLNNPQGKLVRVSRGKVFDVVVDIRMDSKNFGKSVYVELSDDNMLQLYVPPGFAHGFFVLSDVADFEYKCTDYYRPNDEYGINWSDSDLNIPWPTRTPIVSEKDSKYLSLAEVSKDCLPVLNS